MKEVLEIYSYAGSLQTGPEFMVELGIEFFDIAYFGNLWWYACDDSEFPIRVYNGSGQFQFSIPATEVPAAHGLTFDPDGYLWVSNLNTDEIYKVEIEYTSLTRSTWGSIKATF